MQDHEQLVIAEDQQIAFGEIVWKNIVLFKVPCYMQRSNMF